MPLLAELCKGVNESKYKFGRPPYPASDMLFSAIFKVYSTRSLRRFMGDLKIAKEKGYIDKVPCFASIGHFMQRKEITSILQELVLKSSYPLRTIETEFAVDSSGFSTCRFKRWYNFKYGKMSDFRIWIKCNLVCGVRTNIVTSVRLSKSSQSDYNFFKPLLEETAKSFKIGQVSADKAYLSKENFEIVSGLGGEAFIPFKSNSNPKARGSPLWRKMYHYFMYNREEFMKHYHKRSNVETTFYMIKTKFGEYLKSKTKEAQINELLCKVLCHNLCVLIHELHEMRGASVNGKGLN